MNMRDSFERWTAEAGYDVSRTGEHSNNNSKHKAKNDKKKV